MVRTIVEMVGRVPGARAVEEELVLEVISWCRAQKRKFLRLRVQCRLAELLHEKGAFAPCLAQVEELLSELKTMDDKNLLVDVFLTEAKAHHGLRNLPKVAQLRRRPLLLLLLIMLIMLLLLTHDPCICFFCPQMHGPGARVPDRGTLERQCHLRLAQDPGEHRRAERLAVCGG